MINTKHPRLVVPNNIVSDISIHQSQLEKNSVDQVFPESFFEWLEDVVFVEDWGAKSWAIASETLLWNPISALQEAWSNGEMKDHFEADSLKDFSADQVFDYLRSLEQSTEEGDAPGLHIFPLQITDELLYLVGSMEFWQGGFVPEWIGITRNIDDIDTLLQSKGLRSLSDPLTSYGAESIWRSFKFGVGSD